MLEVEKLIKEIVFCQDFHQTQFEYVSKLNRYINNY